MPFQLRAGREVIFDGMLLRTGDQENVIQPRCRRFRDDILNHRPIQNRQHLLGHRLGRGKHPCTQTSDGNDGFMKRQKSSGWKLG